MCIRDRSSDNTKTSNNKWKSGEPKNGLRPSAGGSYLKSPKSKTSRLPASQPSRRRYCIAWRDNHTTWHHIAMPFDPEKNIFDCDVCKSCKLWPSRRDLYNMTLYDIVMHNQSNVDVEDNIIFFHSSSSSSINLTTKDKLYIVRFRNIALKSSHESFAIQF